MIANIYGVIVYFMWSCSLHYLLVLPALLYDAKLSENWAAVCLVVFLSISYFITDFSIARAKRASQSMKNSPEYKAFMQGIKS